MCRSISNSRPLRSGAKLTGTAKLKRLDFGVGQGDWKSTEWVGDTVKSRSRSCSNPSALSRDDEGLHTG